MSSITFNELRPLLPFVVQQVGTMVQIKPFAGYYAWIDWFDLSTISGTTDLTAVLARLDALEAADLDFIAAFEVLQALIIDQNDLITTQGLAIVTMTGQIDDLLVRVTALENP